MSNMKEQNHEAITSGQRTARTKRNRAPKDLPVLAWTSLPMLGHIRDFGGVGVAQPVWLHPSHRSPEIDDRNLAILQQEHIAARAEALGCRFDSSQREVNGQKVWFMAFVVKGCSHALEQLKPAENGLQCECGKLFPSNEPIILTTQLGGGSIPPNDCGIEKTITLTPNQAAGMLKVESKAQAEAVSEEPPVCPNCDNPYPHSHRGGGYSCEECGHEW